jgi:hypothetical protein
MRKNLFPLRLSRFGRPPAHATAGDDDAANDGRACHVIVIVVVGLLSALPALLFGLPFFGHDGATHAIWYSEFAAQLRAGDWYPRWLAGMNGGLGSPALFYYPPVPYYLTAPLRLFFGDDPEGWRQLGVSAAAAQVASGLCAYVWLRGVARPGAAALAAALYVLTPYHLGLDLYRRAAFAELWAFVWMPLVMYYAVGAARGGRRSVVGLASAYGLLAATHLPVTLIFSPVPVCYALYSAGAGRRARASAAALCAMALGAGLAAAYLLPALTLQDHVRVGEMARGFLHYENWFLVTRLKPWGATAGYFWIAFVTAGLCACACVVARRGPDERVRREARFWAVVAGACVVMMLPLSRPVWVSLPALQKIQFPWRFNAVLCVALAALLALGFSALRAARPKPGRGLRAFALILFAFWLPYAAAQAWRAYPVTRPHAKDLADIARRLEQRRDTPEYLPRWVETVDGSRWEAHEETLRALLQRAGREVGAGGGAAFVGGEGRAVVEGRGPRHFVLRVSSPRGGRVRVAQFYYPGWTARADGVSGESAARPAAPDGLTEVFVPAGEHRVRLTLGRSSAELYGLLISAASLLVLLALLGFSFAPRRRQLAAEEAG